MPDECGFDLRYGLGNRRHAPERTPLFHPHVHQHPHPRRPGEPDDADDAHHADHAKRARSLVDSPTPASGVDHDKRADRALPENQGKFRTGIERLFLPGQRVTVQGRQPAIGL